MPKVEYAALAAIKLPDRERVMQEFSWLLQEVPSLRSGRLECDCMRLYLPICDGAQLHCELFQLCGKTISGIE
jgi:hypothetical protein